MKRVGQKNLKHAGPTVREEKYKMEQAYICDAIFPDSGTIRLSEESSVSEREIQLIIIPKKASKSL